MPSNNNPITSHDTIVIWDCPACENTHSRLYKNGVDSDGQLVEEMINTVKLVKVKHTILRGENLTNVDFKAVSRGYGAKNAPDFIAEILSKL
jgi:hypothetical protein